VTKKKRIKKIEMQYLRNFIPVVMILIQMLTKN